MVVNTQHGRRRQRVQIILSHNYREKSQNRPVHDPNNHLEIWQGWQDFQEETLYFEKTEIKDKVSALKIYGGSDINKLARALPNHAPVAGDSEHRKLKRKLDNRLLPKKNKHHAQYTFSKQQISTCEKLWQNKMENILL